eukprot:4933454-Ditylum_brightwellii.AAC.1
MKLAFCQMQLITKGVIGRVVSKLHVPNPVLLKSPAMYDSVISSLNFLHTKLYVSIEDQDKMMAKLIDYNKLHLQQAFDTPFARPEIQNYIGEFGIGKGTKKIINGNFEVD